MPYCVLQSCELHNVDSARRLGLWQDRSHHAAPALEFWHAHLEADSINSRPINKEGVQSRSGHTSGFQPKRRTPSQGLSTQTAGIASPLLQELAPGSGCSSQVRPLQYCRKL